jgi:EAL domain-containing protein (putative c-di-GMP-specific phosphodiesterase class I)
MLVEVANRLRQCVRPQDTLSRIGGDEFALLIDGTDDIAIPVTIAERIREILLAPIQLGRQAIFPSCSMGIALSLGRLENPEALIRDADIAMYQAKREGRGGYAIFDPAMHAEAVMMLALRTDLRFAIERGEFRIVYQPIVRPADGLVVAFEALVRWHHPDRGLVTPAQFIPIAEKMGLIRQIDRWMMREACAQLRRWHAQPGRAELRISVNTSVAGFTDPDFFDELSEMLVMFGLAPQTIDLEITESIFLHPSPAVINLIRRFRALGIRIALDDFGTGYSSLSYVTQYQIDSIKIDRSFISDICTDLRTRAVLELIAKLGITLDIQTIAEGIENEEQAQLAAALGCSYLQGFHFAEPLAASEASALLRANSARP